MNDFELNLGPFNQCVELLEDGELAEYPVDFYGRMFVSTGVVGRVVIVDSGKSTIIPTYDVESSMVADDTEENRKLLQIDVGLKILSIIYRIADDYDIDTMFVLERIVIPVRTPINFSYDGKTLKSTIEIGLFIATGRKIMIKQTCTFRKG